MTSTIGVKKIQHTNGTQVMTFDTAGKISSNVSSTGNITTTGTVNTPSINGGQIGGRRNVIINGGFTVSQRNGTALTATTNNTYFLDRWRLYLNGSCAVSTQQMLAADSNVLALNTATGETFNNVLSIDCTTAASLGGTDLLGIIQMIEGYNTVPLAGQTCTLSFHVKTNVTGQYYVAFKISGSGERTYLAPYTVSSADTWEKKTITFTMDTLANLNSNASVTNSSGLQVYFGLRLGTSGQMSDTLNAWHAGNYYGKSDQVTWGTNTSDTFYLGGIQLEKSSQATSFEHRSYGEESQLCKRYYEYMSVGAYPCDYSSGVLGNFYWSVEKRANPTLSSVSASGGHSINLQSSYGRSGGYVYKASKDYNSVQGLIGDAEL
jgi:hypothetical protein|tara:strand:- start:672 stop:1805 length:1134 start_codon:yes stop_codon:yes gene_type:complete